MIVLLVFILINSRYQAIENVVCLDQSVISSINIEMSEPYEEHNGSFTARNDIAEITEVLRSLEISECKIRDTIYTEELMHKYKIIIYYTDSTPPAFIRTFNSKYVIIDKKMYIIKNGKGLIYIYDIISNSHVDGLILLETKEVSKRNLKM